MTNLDCFLNVFLAMPSGHRRGNFLGRRFGYSVSISLDGKRRKLYAEELGGTDHIIFNLYLIDGKPPLLRPCKMPEQKVIDFVLGLEPDAEED